MLVIIFLISILLIVVFVPNAFQATNSTYTAVCPMCHIGECEYKVSGSHDQFHDTIKPCSECGYSAPDEVV